MPCADAETYTSTGVKIHCARFREVMNQSVCEDIGAFWLVIAWNRAPRRQHILNVIMYKYNQYKSLVKFH